MIDHKQFRFAVAAVPLLLIFCVMSTAQAGFDRPRSYDVLHYTIRLRFDAQKKALYGDTTVRLKADSTPLNKVVLDSIGLRYTSVQLEGAAGQLPYKVAGGEVSIDLGRTVPLGESVAIRLKYTVTNPPKGVFFISGSPPSDKFSRPAQIWSQNEPEDARYWFPSFDFPSDKATSEEFITVKKGETAIGNGEFIGVAANPDGTSTYHYRMDVPHSTYLMSFVVGSFARLSDKYRDIPLAFYAYSDRQQPARIAFSRTKDMMAAFESVTGVPFPFAKYDQVMVSGFDDIDGMENVTATTLADNTVLLAEVPAGRTLVEDLVSHELAHSWFGNFVTCRNWSELWLNEGFATYMEAVWRERSGGRDAYIGKLLQDRLEFLTSDAISRTRHGLRNIHARPDDSLFDSTTYQKGALVVHILRNAVGDAAFWQGVRIYLDRHKFGSVVSKDLQTAMEEASGQKLDGFFDQWVYRPGYPRLEVRHRYDAAGGTVDITISQVQKEDDGTPAVYRFPLDVEVMTNGGPVTQTFDITKRSETFSVKTGAAATKLVVDKREKVILKTVKLVE